MITILLTIACTWAALVAIAAVADQEVREAVAGALLYPLIFITLAFLRLTTRRFLVTGPRRMRGGFDWARAHADGLKATVIVSGRRHALIHLTEGPTPTATKETDRV